MRRNEKFCSCGDVDVDITAERRKSAMLLVLIETRRTGRAKPSFALKGELAVFIVQRFLNYV